MSRMELIDAVVATTASTRATASKAVDAVFDAINAGLVRDGRFRVTGFGSFAVKDTSARRGRNPRTGDDVSIPAGRRVGFRAGAELRDVLGVPAPARRGPDSPSVDVVEETGEEIRPDDVAERVA